MRWFATYSLVVLFCAALLAFAPSADAVDGVVLINQNTSVNGLPGCARTGFPIVICQSGSYRLSGNLTISDVNTDGIDVHADNVTLDLNGFAISGVVTCAVNTFPVQCSASGQGIGIRGVGDNVTVSNGTVRGMGEGGISLVGSGVLVEAVRVEQNANVFGFGIGVNQGIVTRCTVEGNAGNGIVAGSGVVSLNTVIFNGGDGIFSGADALIENNSIVLNGQDGIHGGLLASYNTVTQNIGFGITGVTGIAGNAIFFNGFGNDVGNGLQLEINVCNTTFPAAC